jgi:hypothetical protein
LLANNPYAVDSKMQLNKLAEIYGLAVSQQLVGKKD